MILSIQSSLARGYVGNSAAAFALQRHGLEVARLDTVTFSNHPGYGALRGRTTPAEDLRALLDGLEERGWLEECQAVLSGYLGAPANGAVVLDAVARIRSTQGRALFCCDPVMGDRAEGLYVDHDIVSFFTTEAPKWADILTPNHFELEVFARHPLPTQQAVIGAARTLLSAAPSVILVTSVTTMDLPGATISTLAVTREAAWRVTTPLLPDFRAKGSGDVLTALFLAHLLTRAAPAEALARSVSGVFAVIEATVRAGATELCLVAAQDLMVRPPNAFAAETIAAFDD